MAILASDLAEVLRPIVEQHDREREEYLKSGLWPEESNKRFWTWGSDAGQVDRKDGTPLSGMAYIAENVGTEVSAVQKIMTGKQKWVTFQKADEWLSALSMEHLLNDGTLHIVPNPRWTAEHWQSYMEERGCV